MASEQVLNAAGPAPSKIWKYSRLLLVVLLAAGYGYRLLTRLDIHYASKFKGDAWEYQSMAVNFAHGKGLKKGQILPWETYAFDNRTDRMLPYFEELGKEGGRYNLYRTPGYPFLLGLFYRIVGVRPGFAMHVQVFFMVMLAALLPFVGEEIAGIPGFLAGIPAGALFLYRFVGGMACTIMSEWLICFVIVVLAIVWMIYVRRMHSVPRSVLLGLVCAAALLVKGSLVFVPPLLLLYLVGEAYWHRTTNGKCILVYALAAIIPLLLYSGFVWSVSGRWIFLSTQGKEVFLDGNNLMTAADGRWHTQWRNDPSSYYRQRLAETPGAGTLSLVGGFWKRHLSLLPRALYNKLDAGFGYDPAWRFLIVILLGYLTMVLLGRAPDPEGSLWGWWLSALAMGAITFGAKISFPALCMGAVFLLLLTIARRNTRWELVTVVGYSQPIVVVTVVLNFLLMTLLVFGNVRFTAPALSLVYLVCGSFLIAPAWRLIQAWRKGRL